MLHRRQKGIRPAPSPEGCDVAADIPERSDGSGFVMSALPNRRCAVASGNIGRIMQDLLQQLDLDYYRSALLLVAHAELERLRQECSAGTDVERRSKTPFGAVRMADGAPRKVRCE
jgi:hypothetical protein